MSRNVAFFVITIVVGITCRGTIATAKHVTYPVMVGHVPGIKAKSKAGKRESGDELEYKINQSFTAVLVPFLGGAASGSASSVRAEEVVNVHYLVAIENHPECRVRLKGVKTITTTSITLFLNVYSNKLTLKNRIEECKQ